MANETPQEPADKMTFTDLTVAAVGFEKIVVLGILCGIAAVLWFSYRSLSLPLATDKTIEFVLSFFKDIGLILVGALANSVQHKQK